ncbi:HsmA family protein [Chloroflexota bacterium]
MTSELVISTILISLALIFYSIGVWSERLAGRLKRWHLVFFWGGLVFDTAGTGMMFEMAGGMGADIHSVTGLVAILLMLVHAAWATAVLVLKNEKAITNFHNVSVFVWAVWLVPYFTGFFASMR